MYFECSIFARAAHLISAVLIVSDSYRGTASLGYFSSLDFDVSVLSWRSEAWL